MPSKQTKVLSFHHQPIGEPEARLWDSILSKTTAGRRISRQLKERWRKPRRQILCLLCRSLLIPGPHRLKDMKRANSSFKTQKGVSCFFPIQNKWIKNNKKNKRRSNKTWVKLLTNHIIMKELPKAAKLNLGYKKMPEVLVIFSDPGSMWETLWLRCNGIGWTANYPVSQCPGHSH